MVVSQIEVMHIGNNTFWQKINGNESKRMQNDDDATDNHKNSIDGSVITSVVWCFLDRSSHGFLPKDSTSFYLETFAELGIPTYHGCKSNQPGEQGRESL